MFTICQHFYTLGGEDRRRTERIMSICLIGFLIGWCIRKTQVIPELGLFYKNVGILLGGRMTVKNYWGLLTGLYLTN